MEVIKINKIFKKSWKEHILVERRFYFHFASMDALVFHLIRNKISFEISECFLQKKNKTKQKQLPAQSINDTLYYPFTILQCDCIKASADPSLTGKKELCFKVGEFSLHTI